ncbi:hypothetical protein CDD82_2450 [Ophiocordyceps australis]|uniref:Non-structural maintenance of chromosomes element 1 homolog n=1 Tax=Ophiocordyceps australis TaxID=1399860 RepID=A0A2C5XXR0_9HYPO|nr:hypothetical protein CDD82_2450 [Ophiocordyceps australis]
MMQRQLDPRYNDGHRAFLQGILVRGAVSKKDLRILLANILTAANGDDGQVLPDDIPDNLFTEYLTAVSDAASLFDYEIRSTYHQLSKQHVYALVNTTSDPQTQLATFHTPQELSFIKRVLDAIFDTYNTPRMEVVAITEMQAMKLARPPNRRQSQANDDDDEVQDQPAAEKGLKHSEVEDVLRNLVDQDWLEKSKDGFYSPTPRTLLELRPWLIEVYNDPDAEPDEWQRIKLCEACKDILTIGRRCQEPSCNLRLHDICHEAFFRSRRSKNCPKCDTAWTGERYVGERAITMTKAYQKGRRRDGGARRSTLADDIMHQEGGGQTASEQEDDVDE